MTHKYPVPFPENSTHSDRLTGLKPYQLCDSQIALTTGQTVKNVARIMHENEEMKPKMGGIILFYPIII